MFLRSSLLALLAIGLLPHGAQAAESYDSCTGFIDTLPATITKQGTWCLRKDLATAITSGRAIDVATNNVTIDCNGFKLGNLQAGMGTQASGVGSGGRSNIVVRNCNVRGFMAAINLSDGGGHQVVGNRVEGATYVGISVGGNGSVVSGNAVKEIGGTTSPSVTDEPVGISTSGSVDVVDNAVASVAGQSWVRGISTFENEGGSVRGNRIRDLVSLGGYQTIGIENFHSGSMLVSDNDIANEGGGSKGINCTDTRARARGNVINGFATAVAGCANVGNNVIAP